MKLYDARQIAQARQEDYFCGKHHGIPMDGDACYTNHDDAEQNDREDLQVLSSSAGCNLFMELPMGDDVMLDGQRTSVRDDATRRRPLGLWPAQEYETWLAEMAIMKSGKLAATAEAPSVFG
jgi:ethanolamine ammonia-lyase large subunit